MEIKERRKCGIIERETEPMGVNFREISKNSGIHKVLVRNA